MTTSLAVSPLSSRSISVKMSPEMRAITRPFIFLSTKMTPRPLRVLSLCHLQGSRAMIEVGVNIQSRGYPHVLGDTLFCRSCIVMSMADMWKLPMRISPTGTSLPGTTTASNGLLGNDRIPERAEGICVRSKTVWPVLTSLTQESQSRKRWTSCGLFGVGTAIDRVCGQV